MMKINIFSMKKSVFIGIFIIFLLFLTACGTTKPTTPTSGFIGGKDGMVASFLTDDPPAKVYDDSTNPFRMSLMIENKGEYDIQPNDILVTVDGIDYDSFSIKSPTQRNPSIIEKVRRDTAGKALPGGKSVDISFEANYKEKVPASQPYSIGMNICYKYNTQAIAKTCLRKDVTARPLPSDRCKIEEAKLASNSGAPVQVTSITQRPSGKNTILVVIGINNVGKGEIYDPSFLSKGTCISDPVSGLQNNVHVKVTYGDNKPSVTCSLPGNSNEGTIKLIGGSQRITCTVDTANVQSTTFEKAINVELNYVYKDYITKSIIIDRSL